MTYTVRFQSGVTHTYGRASKALQVVEENQFAECWHNGKLLARTDVEWNLIFPHESSASGLKYAVPFPRQWEKGDGVFQSSCSKKNDDPQV